MAFKREPEVKQTLAFPVRYNGERIAFCNLLISLGDSYAEYESTFLDDMLSGQRYDLVINKHDGKDSIEIIEQSSSKKIGYISAPDNDADEIMELIDDGEVTLSQFTIKQS